MNNTPAKILVVDDEPSLQAVILQLFKVPIKEGAMQFYFAPNGKEALEIMTKEPTLGIILTDINMPVMDGLSFLDKLQELKAIYRAVVISAYGDWTNIRTAMNKGACDFIPKPIDLKDLESTVKKIIAQYDHLNQMNKNQNQLIEFRKELEIASSIQKSILPQTLNLLPALSKFQVFGKMTSAQEIGGDLYNIFMLDDNHLGFEVADVSGKGIPASLFMTMTSALIEGFSLKRLSPKECIESVNQVLSKKNEASMFVTAIHGNLNLSTGEIKYCNAGHNPPFLINKEGDIREIGRGEGLPLGVIADPSDKALIYQEKEFKMEPGETLLLYTDGAIDALNGEDNRLEEHGFKAIIKKYAKCPVEEMIKSIDEDIKGHIGTTPQADDITLVGIQFSN